MHLLINCLNSDCLLIMSDNTNDCVSTCSTLPAILPAPKRAKLNEHSILPHDVTRSRAVRKEVDARPPKSSLRVKRVIMSSARFG